MGTERREVSVVESPERTQCGTTTDERAQPCGATKNAGQVETPAAAKPHPKVIPVIGLLLENRITEAEIKLRELVAAAEFHAAHKHKQQIARIEQYFTQQCKARAWPPDATPGQLIKWRGQIGRLLDVMPLGAFLADLDAEGQGRKSLLYFISSEGGKRASRWEMKALDHREAQWQAEKQKEAEAADAFFKEQGTRIKEAVEPEWVKRQRTVLKAYEQLAVQPDLPLERKYDCQRSILQIRERLAAEGY